jgi:hypothetical protein
VWEVSAATAICPLAANVCDVSTVTVSGRRSYQWSDLQPAFWDGPGSLIHDGPADRRRVHSSTPWTAVVACEIDVGDECAACGADSIRSGSTGLSITLARRNISKASVASYFTQVRKTN